MAKLMPTEEFDERCNAIRIAVNTMQYEYAECKATLVLLALQHQETKRVLRELVEALHSIKSIDSHGTPYYQFFIPQSIAASRSAPLDGFVADALTAAEGVLTNG